MGPSRTQLLTGCSPAWLAEIRLAGVTSMGTVHFYGCRTVQLWEGESQIVRIDMASFAASGEVSNDEAAGEGGWELLLPGPQHLRGCHPRQSTCLGGMPSLIP